MPLAIRTLPRPREFTVTRPARLDIDTPDLEMLAIRPLPSDLRRENTKPMLGS